MFRFLAWLANWWSLVALTCTAAWWTVRTWRSAGVNTKKKLNAVIVAGCVGYVCVQTLPTTWEAQHHRERARSMDVRFLATPTALRGQPNVAAFLSAYPQQQKPFVRVLNVDGQPVTAFVRRQSNRDLELAIDTLMGKTDSIRVSAGVFGGTAACRREVSGAGRAGRAGRAVCGWTNYGITATISSNSMNAEALGRLIPSIRSQVEQRVDRYHPYAESFDFTLVLVGLLLLLVACTISHELSHAAFARFLGCDVVAICIGAGRTLFDRDIRGVRVLIKVIPLGGYVQNIHRTPRGYRWRQAAISTAGPIENFALAVAFSTLFSSHHPTVILNVAMGAINLVPFSKFIPEAGTRIGTDGYQVIRVLSGKRTYNPESVTAVFEVRAETALERKRPADASEWINRGLAAHPNNPALLALEQRVLASV